MTALPEINYFGTLLEVMTDAELRIFFGRLRSKGQRATADALADELAERHLPPDYPSNANLP